MNQTPILVDSRNIKSKIDNNFQIMFHKHSKLNSKVSNDELKH